MFKSLVAYELAFPLLILLGFPLAEFHPWRSKFLAFPFHLCVKSLRDYQEAAKCWLSPLSLLTLAFPFALFFLSFRIVLFFLAFPFLLFLLSFNPCTLILIAAFVSRSNLVSQDGQTQLLLFRGRESITWPQLWQVLLEGKNVSTLKTSRLRQSALYSSCLTTSPNRHH